MAVNAPNSLNDLMRLFDPEQLAAPFKLSTSAPVDYRSLINQHQKSYEAMIKANQSATEAYQDFYQRQMSIFNDVMTAAQAVAESEAVTASADAASRQAQIYQAAVEWALDSMTEFAVESRNSSEEVANLIAKRVTKIIEQLPER